jgi:hypothetical protein
MERVVQEYAPLRCSPKPTPSGIAKRVRQNAELARRASLKVLAMGFRLELAGTVVIADEKWLEEGLASETA